MRGKPTNDASLESVVYGRQKESGEEKNKKHNGTPQGSVSLCVCVWAGAQCKEDYAREKERERREREADDGYRTQQQ